MRTLDSLLRRGEDLPVDVACAVLAPVAITLDALHRRGRAHGGVSADRVTVTLGDQGLDVELLEPEPVDPSGERGRPSGAGDRPSIAGDYVSFGSLLVRGLVRTLGPDDRRTLSQGHDPVTGRRATSCAALVEAARVAVAPLPGGDTDLPGFWDDLRPPLLERYGRGLNRRGVGKRGVRRLALVAVAVLGVVGLVSVLVTRSSGGNVLPASSEARSDAERSDDARADETARDTTTTQGSGRDAASQLFGLVPATLRGACHSADIPDTTEMGSTTGAAASVECEDDGRSVRYILFDDNGAMTAAFAAEAPPGLRGPTDVAGPARCAAGEVEERAWSRSAGDPPAGRYRCEIDSEGVAVVWTTEAVGVLARVEAHRDDADLSSLFSLWRSGLGPVAP